mgnify:CR=1 FL=1
MAADDVTNVQPLNGGRQRANHIQVHRIEAGLWERQNILKPLAQVAEVTANMAESVKVAKNVAMVVAAGAMGLSAYGLYWFFDSAYEIAEKAASSKEKYWDTPLGHAWWWPGNW